MFESPSWIHLACQRWGATKRRIWSGGDWYIDRAGGKRFHVDGYANSFLGKLVEERFGSGHRQLIQLQFWDEVFSGDALEIQRAMPGMPEVGYVTVHLQYVFDPELHLTAGEKATLIGLSIRGYWRGLEMAKIWLWSRLEPAGPPQQVGHNTESTQPQGPPRDYFQRNLQRTPKRATNSALSAKLPSVCLQALRRPTLTLPPRPCSRKLSPPG